MNDKILEILRKNGLVFHNEDTEIYKKLNSAIIEVCNKQKVESASIFQFGVTKLRILNSKNIAE
jgi:hypothetical protein